MLRLQLANLRELAIALDQALNVLVCVITFRRGYSDETLSAHAWRSYRDGKPWGRFFLPIIDVLFLWQKADPAFTDENGVPVKSHCHRAYMKERHRRGLPHEYTTGASR